MFRSRDGDKEAEGVKGQVRARTWQPSSLLVYRDRACAQLSAGRARDVYTCTCTCACAYMYTAAAAKKRRVVVRPKSCMMTNNSIMSSLCNYIICLA